VIDLDDAEAVRAADPGGMLDAVAGLAEQVRAGRDAGLRATDLPAIDDVDVVAFCGMGGSGFSGDILRSVFRPRLRVPVDVVRAPELPAYVGRATLVVCSSYSGETSETIACFEEAIARGARCIVVTSGGTLAERAREHGVAVVGAPAGFMPRAAVGHLAFGLLGALEAVEMLPSLDGDVREVTSVLDGLARRLGPEAVTEENLAKLLALRMRGRIPIIWGADGIGAGAAARWRTELNENAKVPAFSSALPELDHNEVAGWSAGAGDPFFLVALRSRGEHPDVAARFGPSIDIARDAGIDVQQVEAAGRTPLAEIFSLITTGGFVSVYLAVLRGVDPSPIDAIFALKRRLSE
jgi:glucose/mannose-6-phosphate isomerase